jgi:hypothetical protein
LFINGGTLYLVLTALLTGACLNTATRPGPVRLPPRTARTAFRPSAPAVHQITGSTGGPITGTGGSAAADVHATVALRTI